MNYTENHKLCQWEATDPIRREDFNRDNAVLDGVLEEINSALAVQARIYCGSYVGTGTYGVNDKTTLTFDFQPKLIILHSPQGHYMVMRRDITTAYIINNGYGYSTFVTWGENSVTWYYDRDAQGQFNTENYIYRYIVLY